METDKETIDKLFEKQQQTEDDLWKVKDQIAAVAGDYLLEMLKEANKRGSHYMSYDEITQQLQRKEPRFIKFHIEEGMYLLKDSGKINFIATDTPLWTVKLVGEDIK